VTRGRRGNRFGLLLFGYGRDDSLLGDSKVEQLGAVPREHYVRWFEVPVDNPGPVSRYQAFSNSDRNAEQFIHGQPAASHPLLERFALEALHHEVVLGRETTDVVHAADPRVTQGRNRTALSFEQGPGLGGVGRVAPGELDGDQPAKSRVSGAVDLPHTTGADHREDFVRADPGPWGETHIRGCPDYSRRNGGKAAGVTGCRWSRISTAPSCISMIRTSRHQSGAPR
jgi:hypothetical protein